MTCFFISSGLTFWLERFFYVISQRNSVDCKCLKSLIYTIVNVETTLEKPQKCIKIQQTIEKPKEKFPFNCRTLLK